MFRERKREIWTPCGRMYFLNLNDADRVLRAHARHCKNSTCVEKARDGFDNFYTECGSRPPREELDCSTLRKHDSFPENHPITQLLDKEFFKATPFAPPLPLKPVSMDAGP